MANKKNYPVFKAISGFMLILNDGSPNTVKCRINIYGIMNNYFEAVNLAVKELENGRFEFEALAFKWASKPRSIEVRKKLWLKIAITYLKFKEEKVKELLDNRECPLKIADIINYFDDDQKISSFKQVFSSANRKQSQ